MTDTVDEAAKERQVATPKAQATTPTPAPIVNAKSPLRGRRVFFMPDGSLAADSFVVAMATDEALRPALVTAMKRLADTSPGLALLDSLSTGFFDRKTGRYGGLVELHVLPDVQTGVEREAGHVEPPAAPGYPYKVYIKNYKYSGPPLAWPGQDHGGQPVQLRGLSLWPPITGKDHAWCTMSVYFVDDAASMMAECLYHELLHVLFLEEDRQRRVRNQPPRDYPTGHADQAKCEIDADFLRLIKSMVDALNEPFARQRPELPGRFLE